MGGLKVGDQEMCVLGGNGVCSKAQTSERPGAGSSRLGVAPLWVTFR